MKFTTITKIRNNHCQVDVFQNHEFWHTYDFHLDRLYYVDNRNIFDHLSGKLWGTEDNIIEIQNAVFKHLLSYGNG